MIPRYDQPGALFPVDPPYWGCEDYYGKGLFGRADFERLVDLPDQLKGRFVMSLNDRPNVQAIFRGFQIEPVQISCGIAARSGEKTARFGEPLISNAPRKGRG